MASCSTPPPVVSTVLRAGAPTALLPGSVGGQPGRGGWSRRMGFNQAYLWVTGGPPAMVPEPPKKLRVNPRRKTCCNSGPICECCGKDLPPASTEAMICSLGSVKVDEAWLTTATRPRQG